MDIQEMVFHLGGNSSADISDYEIDEEKSSIIIDAAEDSLDVVQDFIRDRLLKYGCMKRVLGQIRLAVEEIFINITSYAYRPDVGKAEIKCEVTENPMVVTIQFMDSGKPFDPLSKGEADTSGKMFLQHAGGFGIHLVMKTMDSVDYEYKDGKNILRIRKNLSE